MWKNLMRGALGGLAGTAAHTAVMLGARTLGMGGKLPPQAITDRLLERAGIHPKDEARVALAVANHIGFGAATGALFGAFAPRSRATSILAGTAYGLAVWLASYEGWAPAIGALPHARRDRPDRQVMMVVAHAAFGAVLGAIAARPKATPPEPLRADPTLAPDRDIAAASAITDA